MTPHIPYANVLPYPEMFLCACAHISLLTPGRKQLFDLHICFSVTATLTNCMSEEKGENALAKHRGGKGKAYATSIGNELCEPEGFPQAVGQESWAQQSLSTAWRWLLAGTPHGHLSAACNPLWAEEMRIHCFQRRAQHNSLQQEEKKNTRRNYFPLFVTGLINGLLLWMLYRGAQYRVRILFLYETQYRALNSWFGMGTVFPLSLASYGTRHKG